MSAALLASPAAQAAGVRVSLLGNMLYPWPIVGASATVQSTGNLNFGGGSEVDLMFGSMFGVSVGGHFMQRTLRTTGTMTHQQISIPAQLKLYLGRFFEVGVGGYYALGLNTIAGFDSNDYGLVGGVGFNIPVTPSFSIKLASRYNYALVDISTAGGTNTVNPNNIQVFAGVSFGSSMGGK